MGCFEDYISADGIEGEIGRSHRRRSGALKADAARFGIGKQCADGWDRRPTSGWPRL